MSTRDETTRYLTELVRRRLKREPGYWAEQVNVDPVMSHNASGIVDFMQFKPAWGGDPYEASPVVVEHGVFSFYEVKSCMDDFKSVHGLNFYGDENYLVCERELADELHRRLMLPKGCAVLCPDTARRGLRKVYENGTPYSMRKRTSAELLLCLMVAIKCGRSY